MQTSKLCFLQKKFVKRYPSSKKPKSQEKILKVIDGKILDVIVDLEKTLQRTENIKIILSSKNNKQIFIPKNFGHGYLTLSKTAKVVYFCSENYNKKSEVTINVLDKNLNINWNLKNKTSVSKKDLKGINFLNY